MALVAFLCSEEGTRNQNRHAAKGCRLGVETYDATAHDFTFYSPWLILRLEDGAAVVKAKLFRFK